jgi:hypothetical protein
MGRYLRWSLAFVFAVGTLSARPVRFEIRSGVTAAKLKSGYQRISNADLKRQLSLRQGRYSSSCAFGAAQEFECFLFDWGITYLPPYPTALPGTVPAIPGRGNTPVRHWAPIDQVRDGAKLFGEWEQSVNSGTVFDCNGKTCSMLVQVVVPDQKPDELSYANCRVIRIQDQLGAPESCEQVAVKLQNEVWLNAITGSEYTEHSIARPEFTLRLRSSPPEYRAPSKSAIATELKRAFQEPPLSFRAEGGQDLVEAIAEFRASPILIGWREIVTIEVLLRDLNETPAGVGVVLNVTINVNRQNTPRPEDFHLPDAYQQQLYISRVRSTVDVAIRRVCKSVVQLDSDEFSCVQ